MKKVMNSYLVKEKDELVAKLEKLLNEKDGIIVDRESNIERLERKIDSMAADQRKWAVERKQREVEMNLKEEKWEIERKKREVEQKLKEEKWDAEMKELMGVAKDTKVEATDAKKAAVEANGRIKIVQKKMGKDRAPKTENVIKRYRFVLIENPRDYRYSYHVFCRQSDTMQTTVNDYLCENPGSEVILNLLQHPNPKNLLNRLRERYSDDFTIKGNKINIKASSEIEHEDFVAVIRALDREKFDETK